MVGIKNLDYKCRHFLGYRPCDFAKENKGLDCWNCKKYCSPYDKKILIIKQGEIGDVLRTTPLARAIKEKWPKSRITWLVEGKAEKFILNNKFIDEVVVYSPAQILRFMIEEFDWVICLDKDVASTTIASLAKGTKIGFGFDKRGFGYPFNKEAEYKYMIGASDTLNRGNKLSYMEQVYQITGLTPSKKEYIFELPLKSKDFGKNYKDVYTKEKDIIIGFNYGCGSKLQTRKWPLGHYTKLAIKLLKKYHNVKIILLGGPYEKEENLILKNMVIKSMGSQCVNRIIDPGTDNNIMDFCGLINICDIVVTSVTMGMHVSIALKKKVVVMMGPIVKAEIDTFGLGPILTSKKHKCLGCFKNTCNKRPSCMESINPHRVYNEICKHINTFKK